MGRVSLLDASWAGRSFLAPPSSLSDTVNDRRRFYTSASRKFTDSSMGGSFEVNPHAQFTRNADIVHTSNFAAATYGRGRFESEVLDDNAQLIHFRAGVPKFNSMTTFFGNFYNVNAGSIVRNGREPGALYKLGYALGTIGTLPLQPFIFLGEVIRFFAEVPRGKYYYLKPTMYPYWLTVQNMMNGLMAQLGLVEGYTTSSHKRYYDETAWPDDRDHKASKRAYFPFMNDAGAFDVFAIVSGPQRLANIFREEIEQELDKLSGDPNRRTEEYTQLFYNSIDQRLAGLRQRDEYKGLKDYENAYQAFSGTAEGNWESSIDYEEVSESGGLSGNWVEKAWTQLKAEAKMGSQFVTFRANWTGSQSSSFNNSAGESSLQGTVNAMSSKNRSIRFSLADGNISGGIVGQTVKVAMDSLKDLMGGVLSSVHLSGFMAVAGNAFADIQRVYESSSADFGRTTFTMNLRSWCHDDWMRIQALYLPLFCILGLALPRATGPASYDGPFLLECFNQGRSLIRDGMIESISMEVGTGDAGWAPGMKPLSIDVSVTVIDLSSILSLMVQPVSSTLSALPGGIASVFAGSEAASATDGVMAALRGATYSEDNKYTDFLAVNASQSLEGLINGKRRWALNMARSRAEMATARSPSRVVMKLMDTTPGRLVQALSPETDRY